MSSIPFSERGHGNTLVNGVFSYPSLSNGVGRCVMGGGVGGGGGGGGGGGDLKIFVLDN